jgi:hypothetical protein
MKQQPNSNSLIQSSATGVLTQLRLQIYSLDVFSNSDMCVSLHIRQFISISSCLITRLQDKISNWRSQMKVEDKGKCKVDPVL